MAHNLYHVSTLAKHNTPVALIGLARSGKDYLITQLLRRQSIGLSDPMVDLVQQFAGVPTIWNKGTPGYRRVLQLWGQWGRGLVSDEYPWTPERLAWLDNVRRNHAHWFAGWKLSQDRFGKSSFWIDGAVRRCYAAPVPAVQAISNLRWPSDIDGIPTDWPVVVVVRQYDAMETSLRSGGEDPAVWQDASERLALGLSAIAKDAKRVPEGLAEDDAWDRVDGVFFNGDMDSEYFRKLRESMARFPNKRIFVDMDAKPQYTGDA